MNAALVVLFIIWTPVVCWVSFILGAYLMWCKEQRANPLNSVRTFFSVPDLPPAKAGSDDEGGGFYD